MISKKIVAIGGGENGRILENGKKTPYETEQMDKEIIRLTNKLHPNFLFLGHAFSFSKEIEESYYETMQKIYRDKFGCNCKILKSEDLKKRNKVKELITWADIIYEGGGDTSSMIDLWKKTHFDEYLYDAWEKGKVICGISAGAVCWFHSCNSDCNNHQFEIVECLNWINAFYTPHSNEPGRYESTKEQLKENNLVGLMMSNCSALEIIDDKYRIIIGSSTDPGLTTGYGYKAYWQNNKYYEVKLKITDEFQPLKDLLEKR